MRTETEHGAQHVHEIVIEDEAYNSVGEHLRSDEVQGVGMVASSVIAAILSSALIVAILL